MSTKNLLKILKNRFFWVALPSIVIMLSTFSENISGQQPTDPGTEIAPPQSPPPQQCGPPRLPIYMVYGNDTVYAQTQEMPEFPGGNDSLQKFKTQNIKYPEEAKKAGIEGLVRVNFNIEKDGTLSNIRIAEGVSPSLDAEVLRVTRMLHAWNPGKEKGKPVKFTSGTTFNFELQPGKKAVSENDRGVDVERSGLPESEEEPFVVVEEMPVFPGGDSALLKHVAENIRYPESEKTNNVQGRVIIRFCITKEGGVNKVSILRSVSPELDAEALRVVNALPAFIPGKQGGRAVPVWYMIPITFKLSDSKTLKSTASAKQPFSGYDEAPLFPGGEEAIYKFINSNIKYPESAREQKISGNVIVNYCIGTNGSVEAATIYKGINPDLNAEALRVVKLLPSWQPAKLSGVPVTVWYTIPITFTLK